ncbi:RCC1/BLIP-II, partial [Fomitiporia mediterranea MF3/22]|uniref:RCC1/BLIP-II n=1 Tax=Fomitiporia mediterranea (strain MF3/22) TaxID=694068 RepID=UPI0004408F29
IPYPIQIKFPGHSNIVELDSGGWSYHALDSQGHVYVWGTLDGLEQPGYGFSGAGNATDIPLRLVPPEPIQALSCGATHMTALSVSNQVWTFLSWGRPFRIITPVLNRTSPESTPIQISCGSESCFVLTASGDIYNWWPFAGVIRQQFRETMALMDAEGNQLAQATAEGTIPCMAWGLEYDPQKLPTIPHLPELVHSGKALGNEEDTKVVKLAAMDSVLIALTNKGHVLRLSGLNPMTNVEEMHWEYLPNFSETERIRVHHDRMFAGGRRTRGGSIATLAPPKDVRITHIAADRNGRFVAYTNDDPNDSYSIVLIGYDQTTPVMEMEAEVIPELQYKAIISVTMSNHHNLVLSANGKLYSWGHDMEGCLGLSLPTELPVGAPRGYETQQQLRHAKKGQHVPVPDVPVPTEVHFDHGLDTRNWFCIAVTAAGWHSGALVVDLDLEVSFTNVC